MNFFSVLKELIPFVMTVIAALAPIAVVYRKWVLRENRRNLGDSFRKIVDDLSSDKSNVAYAAAFLLRRFYDKDSEYGIGGAPFAFEARDVSLAVLRSSNDDNLKKILSEGLKFFNPGENKNKSAIRSEKIDLQGVNLKNTFLGGIRLHQADFYRAKLNGCSFRGADLSNSVFYESQIEDTAFVGSNLSSTRFKNLTAINLTMSATTNLDQAVFENVSFRNCKFPKSLEFQENQFINCSFINCEGPDYFNKDLMGTKKDLQIFVSKSGCLSKEVGIRISSLLHKIQVANPHISINFKSIERPDYQDHITLRVIRDSIQKCDGMIVFGSSDWYFPNGDFRADTEDSKTVLDVKMPTPWSQIESGIACALGKPTLVLTDDPSIRDGIFDPLIRDELVFQGLIQSSFQSRNTSIGEWMDCCISKRNT